MMGVSHGSTEPAKPGFRREYREAVKEGRDIDWRCKYCTHAVDNPTSTNETFTSLVMPVAMSMMIDEASVTGWLSARCLISSY